VGVVQSLSNRQGRTVSRGGKQRSRITESLRGTGLGDGTIPDGKHKQQTGEMEKFRRF